MTSGIRSVGVWLFVCLLGLATPVQGATIRCCGADGTSRACDVERRRAEEAARRIERAWPLVGAGTTATFIRAVGSRLAAAAPGVAFRWSFAVIDAPGLQAYSVGGGRLFVSEGTVDVCRTEAELAGVVAHEMGHQLAGHFCPGGAPTGPGRPLPGGLTLHRSPRLEREADRRAIRLLQRAGYDPSASLTLLRRRGRASGADALDAERERAMQRIVDRLPAGGVVDTAAFQSLRIARTAIMPPSASVR